jgi:hypothetical protein
VKREDHFCFVRDVEPQKALSSGLVVLVIAFHSGVYVLVSREQCNSYERARVDWGWD